MELEHAEQLAWQLMREFGLTVNGWMFYWDDAVRRFGSCSQSRRRITLSRTLTLMNTQAEVEDTIRHEIAHALAPPKAGHGRLWKLQCIITGANPKRCYDSADVSQPQGDWSATCPCCKRTYYKFRQPRKTKPVSCARCCREHNHGRFTMAYQLVYRHKNELPFNPNTVAASLGIASITVNNAPANFTVTADARSAAKAALKAEMKRADEMEEMKRKIAALEAKLGSK
jgi:predicted SprT family Zn-dependent metalloprotease